MCGEQEHGREITECYDDLVDQFDSKMNMYDTNKRRRIRFADLLREDIGDKYVLDAGSGTGWFTKK